MRHYYYRSILIGAAGSLFFLLGGCSVYMEATRPTPVALDDYQSGQSRDSVLERLGAPESTATESDGASCDFYRLYTRGYGAGGKIPLAVAEGAADVFTLGLAEVVLTPTEGVTKNEKHPVAICYKDNKIARINTDTGPNAGSAESALSNTSPAAAPSSAAEPAQATSATTTPAVQNVATSSQPTAPTAGSAEVPKVTSSATTAAQ